MNVLLKVLTDPALLLCKLDTIATFTKILPAMAGSGAFVKVGNTALDNDQIATHIVAFADVIADTFAELLRFGGIARHAVGCYSSRLVQALGVCRTRTADSQRSGKLVGRRNPQLEIRAPELDEFGVAAGWLD